MMFRGVWVTAAFALAKAVLGAGAAQAATPSVTVEKPWVRYLLPSIPAAGYMTLQNDSGTDVVVTGASSPACGMLMLHQSQDESGMAMMMAVSTITVPAHGDVIFAPGGYHLMCMTPRMKIGDVVHITLTFQGGGTVATAARVYGAQNGP